MVFLYIDLTFWPISISFCRWKSSRGPDPWLPLELTWLVGGSSLSLAYPPCLAFHPTVSLWEPLSRTQPGKSKVLLRPSGWRTTECRWQRFDHTQGSCRNPLVPPPPPETSLSGKFRYALNLPPSSLKWLFHSRVSPSPECMGEFFISPGSSWGFHWIASLWKMSLNLYHVRQVYWWQIPSIFCVWEGIFLHVEG